MPSKSVYYKVYTNRNKNHKRVSKFSNINKKKRILASIIGGYLALSLFATGLFFNGALGGSGEQSFANFDDTAAISSSIRLTNAKEYKIGDIVEGVMVVQNTSVVETIRNTEVNLLSTNNSVEFKTLSRSEEFNKDGIVGEVVDNKHTIDVLVPGERVDYEFSGVLNEASFSYLAVKAQFAYYNDSNLLTAVSNKVFTKLNTYNDSLLTLSADQESYIAGQEILLNLTSEEELTSEVEGTVYVTLDSVETVFSYDCIITTNNDCIININGLELGQYSTVFISNTSNVTSNIVNFNLVSDTPDFVPNDDSSFLLPFGGKSLNGRIAIRAEDVVSQNQSWREKVCKFEVYDTSEVSEAFYTTTFALDKDRNCYGIISVSDLGRDVDQVLIKLGGTELSQTVQIINAVEADLPLALLSQNVVTGVDLNFESVDVNSLIEIEDPNDSTQTIETLLDGVEANFHLYHPRSGEYQVLKGIGTYNTGSTSITLPKTFIDKGGFYQLLMDVTEVEDENTKFTRYSDIIGISFDTASVGVTTSPITLNKVTLAAGESFLARIDKLVNKSGSTLDGVACTASIYPTNINEAITIESTTQEGVCEVEVPAQTINTSGPALITFQTDDRDTSISQSSMININSGLEYDYGEIRLQNEPAIFGYSNKIIVGPITDIYTNLVNTTQVIKISDANGKILFEELVEINQGYGEVVVPASAFTEDLLVIEALNNVENIVLEKEILTAQKGDNYIIAKGTNQVNSDGDIEVGLTNYKFNPVLSECSLEITDKTSSVEITTSPINFEDQTCEIRQISGNTRKGQKLLATYSVGEAVYNYLINQSASVPDSQFFISPEVSLNEKEELNIKLLSTPITDKQGLLVDNTLARIEFNGNKVESLINKGVFELPLKVSDLGKNDIRDFSGYKFVDLDIDARASIKSIARTNSISIFIDNYDISEETNSVSILKGSNKVTAGKSSILRFASNYCSVKLNATIANSFFMDDNCYVQVSPRLGANLIEFENNGFKIGFFEFEGVQNEDKVVWCDTSPCNIQMITAREGTLEVVLHDDGELYKFNPSNIENVVEISRNGVNPFKEYLVEVIFTNQQGESTKYYNTISGEILNQQ